MSVEAGLAGAGKSAAATGGSASPPPPLPAPSDADRREREALGEFTRVLVQTLNRASYYDPDHPAHQSVDPRLYESLAERLVEQPQIGYLVQRGTTTEIFVDGLAGGRIALSHTMAPGVYELFSPRFIEYFDRHDLVMLAFRRGLTLDEFDRFIGVMARTAAGRDPQGDLDDALAAERVLHVSTVSWKQVGHEHLPWQVRVCLARMRRDLRTLPLFSHATEEEIHRTKLQIFEDVVRPLTQAQHLKLLMLHAPAIERDLAEIPGLQSLDLSQQLLAVLRPQRLVDLTRSLVDELDLSPLERDVPAEQVTRSIDRCARRIVDERVADAEPVICGLYERGLVAYGALTPELQERVRAEELARKKGRGALAQLVVRDASDVRVLGRVARLLHDGGKIDHVLDVLDGMDQLKRLRGARGEAAVRAVEELLTDEELRLLAERFEERPWNAGTQEAQLLRRSGARAAAALVGVVVAAGPTARLGNAYHLLAEMGGASEAAVAEALRRSDLQPASLRVLLALGQHRPSPLVALAALRYTTNADPRVRLAALGSALARDGAEVEGALRSALDDADPEVASFAMSHLAARPAARDVVHAHALKVLREASRETAPAVALAALRNLQRLTDGDGDGERREAALAAVRGFIDREQGGLRALATRTPEQREVVEIARRTLAALAGEDPTAEPAQRGRRGWLDGLFNRT